MKLSKQLSKSERKRLYGKYALYHSRKYHTFEDYLWIKKKLTEIFKSYGR